MTKKSIVSVKSVKRASVVPKSTIGILVVAAALILVTGLVVAKKMMTGQQAQVFEVRGGDPVPKPVALTCGSITQFNAVTQCGTTPQFQTATYICSTMS